MSEHERNAKIQQLKTILNLQDDHAAQALLEASHYNVEILHTTQAAIASVLEDKTPSGAHLSGTHLDAAGDIQSLGAANIATSVGLQNARRNALRPWHILLLPLNLAIYVFSSALALVVRFFGFRLNFPSLSLRPLFGRPASLTTSKLTPRQCAERLVRELEEETGTVSGHTSGLQTATTTAFPVASSSARVDTLASYRRLPKFHIGSYDSALREAKENIQPICVIIISSEHQDTDEFKRCTLTDPEFIRCLEKNNFVIWIGDIKYPDAYQACNILEATTFPFVAFISIQRQSGTLGSTSTLPKMTVFSRLEGPPSSVTSPRSLVSHIEDTFIPRTSAYMERLRREKQSRETERRIREEQDRAYEEAGRRDLERHLAKVAEAEAKRRAKEEEERIAQEHELLESKKAQWRAWANTALLPPEPTKGARISVKLPDGQRLIRKFPSDATLEQVYAWVDCQAFAKSFDGLSSTMPPPEYKHEFDFTLSTLFPKRLLKQTDLHKTLEAIGDLVPDANLVVEGMRLSNGGMTGEDSDEEVLSEDDT